MENVESQECKGTIASLGGFTMVKITGDFNKWSSRYGYLLKDHLKEAFSRIENIYSQNSSPSYFESLLEQTQSAFRRYPHHCKEFFRNMAESSGIRIEQLLLLDNLLSLMVEFPPDRGCSTITVSEEYTGGNPLIFGRCFDFAPILSTLNDLFLVTVFEQISEFDKTPFRVVTLGYPGMIRVNDGINSSGLILSCNDGAVSGGLVNNRLRTPMMISNFRFLLESRTFIELDAAIRSTRSDYPLIINTADNKNMCSYECSLSETRGRKEDAPGLLVSTNHFVDTSWELGEPAHVFESSRKTKKRRNNLLQSAEKNKGNITPEVIMEMLDTPLEKGGPYLKGKTLYQYIAVPEKKLVRVKLPHHQTWTQLPLL